MKKEIIEEKVRFLYYAIEDIIDILKYIFETIIMNNKNRRNDFIKYYLKPVVNTMQNIVLDSYNPVHYIRLVKELYEIYYYVGNYCLDEVEDVDIRELSEKWQDITSNLLCYFAEINDFVVTVLYNQNKEFIDLSKFESWNGIVNSINDFVDYVSDIKRKTYGK